MYGVLAMIDVEFSTENAVVALPPIETELAPTRFRPVMLTPVPPAIGPVAGVTCVTVGNAAYVKTFVPVAVPFGVTTITLTAPGVGLYGVLAMIDVEFSTENAVVALPPIETELAPTRFRPVMLTPVTPAIGPVAGVTCVTVGNAAYVKTLVPVAVPFGVTTRTSTAPAAA